MYNFKIHTHTNTHIKIQEEATYENKKKKLNFTYLYCQVTLFFLWVLFQLLTNVPISPFLSFQFVHTNLAVKT